MEFIEERGTATPSTPLPLPEDEDGTSLDDNEPFDSRRLWIGNIDSTAPEYVLLKLVEPFGDIVKLDFLYHQSGHDKGELSLRIAKLRLVPLLISSNYSDISFRKTQRLLLCDV